MRALLRRGVVLAVVLVAVLGVVGAWVGAKRDQLHQATATILVNPLEGNPFSPDGRDGLVNLETEARLVTADAVARAVGNKTGLDDPDAVLTGVSVEVPPNTQLLRITVERRDAALARRLANAYAEEYLNYREARTASTVFTRQAHLTEELRSMKAQLTSLTKERAAAGVSAERRALLDQQISGLVSQVAQVQAEQTTLGYVSQDPGQVVTPAVEESAGPLPAALLGAIAGAGLGLALALGAVYLRARRADKVGTRTDLVAAGYEVIGSDDDADALRARILVELPQRPAVVLLADAGEQGAASAVTGEALVDSLARARLRTVLVVLDDSALGGSGVERRPMRYQRGLVEVLRGRANLDKTLVPAGDFALRLPPGGTTERPAWGDLLASPEFVGLVKDLRERGEMIVFAGVALPGPDGQLLAGHADAVVIQATTGLSTNAELEAALREVDEGPAQALGIVHRAAPQWRRHPVKEHHRAAEHEHAVRADEAS
ncbi:hypothetical protein NODU109028_13680 [Nocardioides dubius]|uniref:Chain length determinant protein n=2 Tax=Nocardioides dubius TaxID=317019 RepID=A0ABN1TKC8_9ACTN